MLNRSSGIRTVFQSTRFGLLALLVLPLLYWSALSTPRVKASASAPAPACRRGEALEKLGRRDVAEQAYLRDLETRDGLECAPAKLERLGRREVLCEKAEELTAAGDEAAAKATYEKTLEAEPRSRCASRHLAKAENPTHWWEWAATAAKDIVAVLGFIAAVLACFALLAWAVLQVLTRWHLTKDRLPARWLLRPSLEVKPLDDTSLQAKMGPAVANLVRARVNPRKTGGIDVVTGHAALGNVLKPLADVSSEAKAAVALVSFLLATLPRRNFEATGALQARGEMGRGVSVELTNENSQLASATLWEHDFHAPDDDVGTFQRLAVPAAGWLDHRIATALGVGDDLLSADPQSWAMFKAGAAWQEEGENGKAKALYESALGIDPANIGAMANLGAIEMQDRNYREALTLLGQALDALTGDPA